MSIDELCARVDGLERENRRLKRVGLAVVVTVVTVAGAALGVALVGAATPEVIEARAFRVIDESGIVRAQMDANRFDYLDENGKRRAIIDAGGFYYFDANAIRASMDDGGITYYDENGVARVGFTAAGTTYIDEKGMMRAQLGIVSTVSKTTGKESRYPAGVALFADDGTVFWMKP